MEPTKQPLRVLIADDHPLIRKGLRQVIEAEPNFEVVGEAADGGQALDMILQQRPQIAILDVSMPVLGGFDVAREAQQRQPDTAIIFLTMHKDKDLFNKALDLSARGYVLKDGALEEIVEALNEVAQGRPFVSRPGAITSWREAEPLGHSVPWLIGERGLPSMSTSSPSRV